MYINALISNTKDAWNDATIGIKSLPTKEDNKSETCLCVTHTHYKNFILIYLYTKLGT